MTEREEALRLTMEVDEALRLIEEAGFELHGEMLVPRDPHADTTMCALNLIRLARAQPQGEPVEDVVRAWIPFDALYASPHPPKAEPGAVPEGYATGWKEALEHAACIVEREALPSEKARFGVAADSIRARSAALSAEKPKTTSQRMAEAGFKRLSRDKSDE